jgi:hypothetical protein
MSRPQKIHKPIKGDFSTILGAIGMGSGKGKQAAKELQKNPSATARMSQAKPKKP